MALRQVFINNMKKRRKQVGLTQEKLAELCNTDACYIRQIEIGRRFPSIDYIERIAKALNIAAYRLFYDASRESEERLERQRERKQRIKEALAENENRIYNIIDEQQ